MRYTTPVIKKNQADDTYKFQPLPAPTGPYPYRMSLRDILPETGNREIIFQMSGDTGSIRSLNFQRMVAGVMTAQYGTAESPQFLYHLGDVVYNHGEADRYEDQFFKPYAQYPGPILAIPGNHDSDVNPDNPVPYKSLAPFVHVFCDTASRPVSFSGGAERKSMTQPNVYWTLDTPAAILIGLYGNVPRYGVITEEQRAWFIRELEHASKEADKKMLLVCLHQAPYTADINHGSSLPMIRFLDEAFAEAGVWPDAVFSGHVHNYQRFSKQYPDGRLLPFIVAGGGGYDELHPIATLEDDRFTGDHPLFSGVSLEAFCDNKHGFLKVSIADRLLTGEYYTLSHEDPDTEPPTAVLTDRFYIRR